MSLTTLIDNTSKVFVNLDSGAGELINYKHVDLKETIIDLKAYPQSGNYKHLNEERSKDSMSFMTVFLDIAPEKNDIIQYNNIEWKVEIFDGSNPYDIVTYSKQNSISKRALR